VTPIRPFERGDLDAVARLFEQVARSGAGSPPPGLAGEFERTVLDHPWADPELPSLVYEDGDSGVVGFLGSHPRRLRLGDRELRLGCSGQLVARPDFQRGGVGGLLLRRYLAGPQDLTITDGATDAVRAMWEGLGGRVNGLASVGWTRVFRPAGLATAMLRRRRGGAARAASAARLPDLAAGRLAPGTPTASSERLEAGGLLEGLDRLARRFPLRPAYDEPFLGWLFRELEAVRSRGELVRRLVRTDDGRPAGWYVAYVPVGGVAQALQVAAPPAHAGMVLDELFHRAAAGGAVAVQGRLEPHLHEAVRERRCVLRRTEWALVHGDDAEALGAIAYGRALLTRMEGEWWMGHHLT
jgi:hypothetical protein